MVTIYDLARETGFSAPTISKAINGNGKLNPKTREIILEAARKAGYTPNMAAKSLSTKHSRLIGVILEDSTMQRGFEHPLFGGLLNRFRHEIEYAGYDLLFLSKNFNGGMSYIEHCKYRDVDGIIIVNPIDNDPEIATLGQCGIPCVSTNEIISGVCTVLSENYECGIVAAEKLIQAGHRKVSFLGAPYRKTSPASRERLNGFKAGLKKHGFLLDKSYVENCKYWNEEAGYEGMKKLYERCPDITSVFIVCDTLAYGAIQFIKEIGKSVPDDISIIGFDDDVFLKTNFNLNTFRQNRDKIAELAAELLLQEISGIPAPEIVRVSADYIERSSVKVIG